jgi:hydroxyethylthiazole kinase-like uncharacterized protein yjeF
LSVRRITTDIAARWLRPRAKQAHKGDAGRVYVVAGSRGMAGAAVLSAIGAVRSGAGLVRVGTVKSQQPVIARRAPLEVTSEGFPEDADGRLAARAWKGLRRAIEKFQADVIAVGPGLGRSRGIELIVRNLLYRQDVPVVLDADGLNALAALGLKKPFRAPVVITPHPGEMSRILGSRVKDRNAAARAAALRFRAVALLKGAGTLVSDGRQTWVNTTGNPAMASGGMGDVLTGIVAASWGQMDGPMRGSALHAAALAAFVHGRAADIAVKRFPERTLLATDVAETLPLAFMKLWRKK